MNFAIDQYSHLNSPIHRWDERYKLIGLLTLMFVFAAVQDLRLIPVMLLVTLIFFSLSKLPLFFLIQRLTYPGFFLLGVIGLLPFLSGQTILWQWGFLTLRQEGCLAVLLIVGRFLSILTLGFVLLGTSSFLSLIKALRSLGLSPILTDMILISYRYLFELGHQFKTMLKASRLRGFNPHHFNSRTLQVYAALAGSLLVRSYQKSEQVYKAMKLRGYDNKIAPNPHKKGGIDGYSAIALFLTLAIAASLLGFELIY